ncbi:MAG: hypothetical protein K6U14_09445 [Firmicutes bacterium]|nr:hypothetical protein [Alicyclobacillaceae bacterium]MCL6497836.1 hypothetical protein [Bacillota bacterium]
MEGSRLATEAGHRQGFRSGAGYAMAVVAAALTLELASRHLANDVFWHLAAGRWMWAHRAVLTRNRFSWDAHGAPWINLEWGWDVLLWGLWQIGPQAAVGAIVGCIVAFLGGLYRLGRIAGADPMPAGLLAAAGGFASLEFWDFRPQVLAYPLAVWWLGGLWRLRPWLDGAAWSRRALGLNLGVLGAVELVWANVHGSWLLAPLWVAVETLFARRRRRGMALGLGAAAVGFLNPWGAAGVGHAVWMVLSPAVTGAVSEWGSPNLHQPYLAAVVLGCAVVAPLGALSQGRRPDLRGATYWAGTVAAALFGVRFLPYLGIGLVGLFGPVRSTFSLGALSRALLAGAAAVLVVWTGFAMPKGPGGVFGPWVDRGREPEGALAYMVRHHIDQRVFNVLNWGGYLQDAGIPDWIDGRLDFWAANGPALTQYREALSGYRAFPTWVQRLGARYALVERGSTWAEEARLSGWPVLYRGRLAVLFRVPSPSRRSRPGS